MMTSKEIRQKFLDFFQSKAHTIVQSAPMVIKNDPTLMFTNAGMNQFKDIFLGNKTPEYNRAADSQKCLRVSGKHNDLEEVGHDSYHHTMFEMLGNWSFGDYFKEEAIDWAWELLTEVYKIDKSKLYATIFMGDEEDGISKDEQAYNRWLKYLPAERILLGNKKDNFWEMGDTGPCGPCSEIHIDLRDEEELDKIPGKELVNKGNPLVIEIWNLVFMQYHRKSDGSLSPLPARCIDTGMGFERLCAVLQGKKSNYDTDIFTGLISKIENISGHKYLESKEGAVAMRVIADHIRAISFSIADGQLPSNAKAGYVIRRILRRAIRYGYTFLGLEEPFLCCLVSQLVKDMGEAYPELKNNRQLIENVVREEELSFLHTLDKGIKRLEDYMHKSSFDKRISGTDAFILYDTYGFPIDLTELIATEHGYTVDLKEFNEQLDKQKDRARNATANEFGDWVEYSDNFDSIEFVGYDNYKVEEVKLLKHRTVKQKKEVFYQLVFEKTPFYAEMGGQVGDSGFIQSASGERINILNTIKENELIIHLAEKIPADCNEKFTLQVDCQRRKKITNNHTATHILDHVLRKVLGSHVEQKGSYIGPDYFRFDFSHFAKVEEEQLEQIEILVNEFIRENVSKEEFLDASMEEAKEMGAIALFGEKYGDKVRVVKFGDSVELCGGTHCKATGQIGLFKIVSESAVAAGVRRIEALSGGAAEKYIREEEKSLSEAKSYFNNCPDLLSAIQKLLQENTDYKKQIEIYKSEKAQRLSEELAVKFKLINEVKVVSLRELSTSPEILKEAVTLLQKKVENFALIAAYQHERKAQLILMYSDDLVRAGKNANTHIKEASKLILGGGGGQACIASAGGKNVSGLGEALDKMIELATKQ